MHKEVLFGTFRVCLWLCVYLQSVIDMHLFCWLSALFARRHYYCCPFRHTHTRLCILCTLPIYIYNIYIFTFVCFEKFICAFVLLLLCFLCLLVFVRFAANVCGFYCHQRLLPIIIANFYAINDYNQIISLLIHLWFILFEFDFECKFFCCHTSFVLLLYTL